MTFRTVSDSDGTKFWYRDDILHRDNGPAIVRPDGTKFWYQNGKRHRRGGPAVEKPDGTKFWYRDGELVDTYYENFGCNLHKVTSRKTALRKLLTKKRPFSYDLYMADIDRLYPEGVVIKPHPGKRGYNEWWSDADGGRHREDGPAIEDYRKPTKWVLEWWVKGHRHREDGPAIERWDGSNVWWLNGQIHREDGPAVERGVGTKIWYKKGVKLDVYQPNFGCAVNEITSREKALERLNSKRRLFSRDMYMADIDRIFPK